MVVLSSPLEISGLVVDVCADTIATGSILVPSRAPVVGINAHIV